MSKNCPINILTLLTALAILLPKPGVQAEQSELLWTQPSLDLPSWVANQVIYEINVRQYSESGTFAAIEKDLPRLSELGVNTLWFMPIHPIGEVNRKGPLGSYYSISDYKGVNPEFGTAKDFKSLVTAAHNRGMRVIMDWVGNHTSWDNPLVKEHPEYYMTNEAGEFIPPLGFDWTDVIQLDFNNPDVLNYQIEVLRYWNQEYGVDGFRCDYATGIPTEFWNQLSAALQETDPDIFMLAEAEVHDHQLKAFHASYAWEVMHAFDAIAQGHEPANHLNAVLTRQMLKTPADSTFLYMTSNHDENSWNGTAFERLGGGVKPFAVLSFTLDGIPLLYNGQEIGLNKRLLFFERDPIKWNDSPLFSFYQTLIRLKTSHPALRVGEAHIQIPTTADETVYAFKRGSDGGPQVLVIANLSAKDIQFDLGERSLKGQWKDVFNNKNLELGMSNRMNLKSWGFRVLVR